MFGLVLTRANLVGILAHDTARFSMLTEHFCFNKIMHFLVSNMCLHFFIFSRITLTRARLALSGILKVPSIHKTIALRIIGQTLII